MRHPLLPLLLLGLASLRSSLCQLTVSVSSVEVKLQESGQTYGKQRIIPPATRASLKCTVTSATMLQKPKVEWRRASSNDELDRRFEVSNELAEDKRTYTSVLTVNRAVDEDMANYSCQASDGDEKGAGIGGFLSLPLPNLKVPTEEDGQTKFLTKVDLSLWQGEEIQIVCDVAGNPQGDIEWSRENGDPIAGVNNSVTIRSLSYERDRGFVACKSSNKFGENTAKIFLRVRNPTAFVLPLIILLVQIAIIVVIVIAYELYMKRKRREQEPEKTD